MRKTAVEGMNRKLGLALVATALAGGSCAKDVEGFSEVEWDRVKLIAPLHSDMPANPFYDSAHSDAIAKLGQKLFYEKGFSEAITQMGPTGAIGDVGKVGCVTCHDNKYFADSRPMPISHGRTWSRNNTPAMVNLGYYEWTNWTGANDSMLQHGANVWSTSASPLAQAHFLANKYRDEYNAAFPDFPLDPALVAGAADAARFPATATPKASPTAADGPFEKMTKADQWAIHQIKANLGKVWDAYPRKLTTPHSAFEKYIKGEDRSEASFSPSAKNGLKLFIGKASCIDCHNGPMLSDNQFHNIGVPQIKTFPPGTSTPASLDRGRRGALNGTVNTALATLRTNDHLTRMDPVMDQVPIFSGAGQFSDDAARGLQRLVDLDKASCLPGMRTAEAVPTICAGIFKAPRLADATATPPVTADPGDPRYQVCVDANTEIGLCATNGTDPTTGATIAVGQFDPLLEGAFRTPTLLNVAETGPYFHTGEFATLKDVVWHYNNGGGALGTFQGEKSPRIKPLLLTESEMTDLVEFLKTLTGEAPDAEWACNPLVGPPLGCGPPGAGAATGGAGGGAAGGAGGSGKGGAGGGAAGGAGGSAKGGTSGATGGITGSGGVTGAGGVVGSGGASASGGASGGGGVPGIGGATGNGGTLGLGGAGGEGPGGAGGA